MATMTDKELEAQLVELYRRIIKLESEVKTLKQKMKDNRKR